MILLSVKAGLRACEIAGLDWSMVRDARGKWRSRRCLRCDRQETIGSTNTRRIPISDARFVGCCERADFERRGHSFGARRLSAANQCCELVRGAVRRARIRGLFFSFRPSNLHFRRRAQTSTAPDAVCAMFSCLRATGRSRRPSATSTATRAANGAWSACCERASPRPCPSIERHPPCIPTNVEFFAVTSPPP